VVRREGGQGTPHKLRHCSLHTSTWGQEIRKAVRGGCAFECRGKKMETGVQLSPPKNLGCPRCIECRGDTPCGNARREEEYRKRTPGHLRQVQERLVRGWDQTEIPKSGPFRNGVQEKSRIETHVRGGKGQTSPRFFQHSCGRKGGGVDDLPEGPGNELPKQGGMRSPGDVNAWGKGGRAFGPESGGKGIPGRKRGSFENGR